VARLHHLGERCGELMRAAGASAPGGAEAPTEPGTPWSRLRSGFFALWPLEKYL